MKDGADGRTYRITGNALVMQLMCYPSGRTEVQVWELKNPSFVLATETSRELAGRQLKDWHRRGLKVERRTTPKLP